MAQTSRLRRNLLKLPFVVCFVCVIYFVCQSKVYKTSSIIAPQFKFYNSTTYINSSYPLMQSFRFASSNVSSNSGMIELIMFYTRAQDHLGMKEKLIRCLSSLVTKTFSPLHLLLITDDASFLSARQVLLHISNKLNNVFQVDFYHVDNVVKPLCKLVSYMQPHFTYKEGAYYSDALFFLSIGIHKVFPYEKLIMTDIDIKFLSDIKELYAHFQNFGPNAVIGIAQEQQPVYRHLLHNFRRRHPFTRAGSPPPEGTPGFNSGILLLNLQKMRESSIYNTALSATTVTELTKKYQFKGHLGDQDFFSLISFEYEDLFYVLPCTWNRQLCQWWKYHGYEDVFDSYYKCNGKINIYHGNCNAYLPD